LTGFSSLTKPLLLLLLLSKGYYKKRSHFNSCCCTDIILMNRIVFAFNYLAQPTQYETNTYGARI